MNRVFLVFLICTVTVSCSPVGCQLPAVKQQAQQCITQLQPMFDQINAAKTGNWLTFQIAKQINDLCNVSLGCFKSLQQCAGIDDVVILNMEGVCDMYGFISGQFQDCLKKLEVAKTNKCVTDFFMNPVYTDIKDNKKRCNTLKSDGKCVEKNIEKFCDKDAAKDFEDQLSIQQKRFSC